MGIIHHGKLIEELDADQLEKLRAKHLEVRVRDLVSAYAGLQSAGYQPVLKEDMILMEEAHVIEHPDDIARILVNGGTPPTHLAVKQQNLEEHFMQLTGGIK